jgi:GGDEF domain-containing protein
MSLGIASRQSDSPPNAEQLVVLADAAMYRAKASNKAHGTVASPAN